MKTSTRDVAFLVYNCWPPLRGALILASLLESWTDSGVNRAENMSSTVIGTKLDNDEKEMEKTWVHIV